MVTWASIYCTQNVIANNTNLVKVIQHGKLPVQPYCKNHVKVYNFNMYCSIFLRNLEIKNKIKVPIRYSPYSIGINWSYFGKNLTNKRSFSNSFGQRSNFSVGNQCGSFSRIINPKKSFSQYAKRNMTINKPIKTKSDISDAANMPRPIKLKDGSLLFYTKRDDIVCWFYSKDPKFLNCW